MTTAATGPRVTLASVTAAVQSIWPGAELVRGDAYFYFVGNGAERLNTASVLVPRLSDLSLARWIDEARAMVAELAADGYDVAPAAARVPVFTRDGRQFVVRAHRVNAQGRADVLVKAPCTRCGGAGGADKWAFTGWTCFECNGRCTRTVRAPAYTAAKTAKLDATAAKNRAKREARAAQLAAERAAAVIARADMLAAHPLHQRVAAHRDASPFFASVLDQWAHRDLSDAQLHAATVACDRQDARNAERAARDAADAASDFVGTVGERIPVAGVVEFVKVLRDATPYDSGSQLLKLRTPAGLLVWFRSLSYGSDTAAFTTGQAVTGTATVKAHETFRDVKQTTLKNARLKAA